ncbi:sulfotransferase [Neiella marina]|uniref:Sulfotransferase n=1 Tax=Neiella holothuriorum TaxID=2870530 RepID=A0ABS7EH16_9GAMM|nr:sulfotransferase [Neiella holothuriorum]MBW8191620.1 sulfotransferase [Neiella holothuriorum]
MERIDKEVWSPMTSKIKSEIIFVAGFPRSGTTWFSNIINSHSKVVYRHEILGRQASAFPAPLFDAIKHNAGLSDIDYEQAIGIIAESSVETDKPPFFVKDHGLLKHPQLHYFLWSAAKLVKPIASLYLKLFKAPIYKEGWRILVKETRSTTDMTSILKGLRVEHVLFLVREPYGAIASHIKGASMGLIYGASQTAKNRWFEVSKDKPYVKALALEQEQIEQMSAAEFLAIKWRVYYEDAVVIQSEQQQAQFCFYDQYVSQPFDCSKTLFESLKLDFSPQVEAFIGQSTGKTASSVALKDSSNEYYSVYRKASFDTEGWKKELSDEDVHYIDKHATPFFNQLIDSQE